MPAAINTSRDNFYRYSSALVEKADHLRLQDINLSWQLPQRWIAGMQVKRLSVYSYANNLGILWKASKYKLDPDYENAVYPPVKTISLGIRAEL